MSQLSGRGIEIHTVQLCTECNFGHRITDMSTEIHKNATTACTDPAPSHREAKRIRTHRAIEDAATALVLERGFQDVTVDDICKPVGISRRTFFNYFNSKEEAVLGSGHRELSEEEVEQFCEQEHPNLPAATLSLLVSLILDPNRDELFSAETEARRKAICEEEPAFIRHQISRFHDAREAISAAIIRYYERYPQARKTNESVEDEAYALTGVVFSTVMSAMHSGTHTGNLTPAHLRATSATMLQATIDLLRPSP